MYNTKLRKKGDQNEKDNIIYITTFIVSVCEFI